MSNIRTLPADWEQVLGRVETGPGASHCQHQKCAERSLTSAAALDAFNPVTGFYPVRRTHEPSCRLSLPAEQRLAQIDADLGAGEEASRQWLTRADAARSN